MNSDRTDITTARPLSTRRSASRVGRVGLLSLLACIPLLTGCLNPVGVVATAFGSIFWWDLALIPVRSALGTATLDFINSFAS